jgi:hypothetical protein
VVGNHIRVDLRIVTARDSGSSYRPCRGPARGPPSRGVNREIPETTCRAETGVFTKTWVNTVRAVKPGRVVRVREAVRGHSLRKTFGASAVAERGF